MYEQQKKVFVLLQFNRLELSSSFLKGYMSPLKKGVVDVMNLTFKDNINDLLENKEEKEKRMRINNFIKSMERLALDNQHLVDKEYIKKVS